LAEGIAAVHEPPGGQARRDACVEGVRRRRDPGASGPSRIPRL